MNYDQIPAGPALDALVAEKIMGWEWWVSSATGGRCIYAPGEKPRWFKRRADMTEGLVGDWGDGSTFVPPYSTNIAAAFTVIEKIKNDFTKPFIKIWTDHLAMFPNDLQPGCWRVVIDENDLAGRNGIADSESLPLAICRSALKAHSTINP